jgi:hypothetical protein
MPKALSAPMMVWVCVFLPFHSAHGLDEGSAAATSRSAAGAKVALTRLKPSPYSYVNNSWLQEPKDVVVRTRRDWDELWSQICRSCEEIRLAHLDFERNMVIVAAMGERRSRGYGIVLESAREIDQRVEITIREELPGGRGCSATMETVRPVDIGIMPKVTGEIVFRHHSVQRTCS